MKSVKFKAILSTAAIFSMMLVASPSQAAPVKFKQVVQVVNVTPGLAKTGSFSRLLLAADNLNDPDGDGDDKKDGDKDKKKGTTETTKPQDDRVITTTVSEIVQDEDCQCDDVEPEIISRGFPKWPLFGLGAIPLIFIPEKDPTPTPTMTPPPTATPTPTAPVPEPMTLLLFGSGLAGVGLAARRRFGKKGEGETEE